MTKCDIRFPLPLPDDPRKWQGWNNYSSPNFYERLCLDPYANPSNELIEEHCRELMRWWQKKLPLKNQPSNPLAQLLRSGLEESSRFLTEARLELLDPERRKALDEQLSAQQHEDAVAEFKKYLEFVLAGGILSAEEEKNLVRFGSERTLTESEINSLINEGLQESGAIRAPAPSTSLSELPAKPGASSNPQEDFLRMLRLSNLDSMSMSDDQRDTFIDMAENLGLDPGEAEDIVDVYLDEADEKAMAIVSKPAPKIEVKTLAPPPPPVQEKPAPAKFEYNADLERARYSNFTNSLGATMIFVPSAEFTMGSGEEEDAAPNERPTSHVTVTRFYISRYLITNSDYERFNRSHACKRAAGAGDQHPVVYVSSLDAIKFCNWLSTRERRKYRLPTEAEWEYAAKGSDNRKFPWGNQDGRGDLANFADKNTVFAWSDHEIDCGYAESSPVGAFPLGASPFGIEDMAGNIWEWCLDYYEAYRQGPKVNPRGPTAGTKRVHRGGSWKSRFSSLRTTVRGSNVPSFSCNDLGFRIVCECD